MTRSKTQSGKVDIVVQSDRLRLRWSWIKAIGGDGRRFVLPLGLPDASVNRRVAEAKARLIKQDLATGHFDPTLAKYRGERVVGGRLSVVALFEKFTEQKTAHVYKTTLNQVSRADRATEDLFQDQASGKCGGGGSRRVP